MNVLKSIGVFIEFSKNKELNNSLNNFFNLKIIPDLINIICTENTTKLLKDSKKVYTFYKTEYNYDIKKYNKLEDLLYEPYTEKNIEYLDYIKDIEDYLINKHKNYFYLSLKNLKISFEKYNFIYENFFNKIQNIEFKNIFKNNENIYFNLLEKSNTNINEKIKKENIFNIVNNELSKKDITLHLLSKNNSITLKLKQKDFEINKLILDEIIDKFFYKDFYLFIKKDSNINLNNNKIDIVTGYFYSNQIINKMNKHEIKNINLSKLSNNKLYYK